MINRWSRLAATKGPENRINVIFVIVIFKFIVVIIFKYPRS